MCVCVTDNYYSQTGLCQLNLVDDLCTVEAGFNECCVKIYTTNDMHLVMGVVISLNCRWHFSSYIVIILIYVRILQSHVTVCHHDI